MSVSGGGMGYSIHRVHGGGVVVWVRVTFHDESEFLISIR